MHHPTNSAPPQSALRPISAGEHTAVAVVAAATGVLGLLGFVNSFARVAEAAAPSFGWFAWTLPLGIDLGIAVFSALDIVLARLDMRVRWLRFIPWSLTGATVYLNIAGETTLFGQIAHAVLPLLWVVAVEVGAHALRRRAGLASPTRMDRVRRSRWLLAPLATALLWRRMVLWEVRSYPDALQRERARVLAKTELQDRYGWRWRWRAPRRERALYRLGELVPAEATMEEPPPFVEAVEVHPLRTEPPMGALEYPVPVESAPKPEEADIPAPNLATHPHGSAPVPLEDPLHGEAVHRYADLIAAGQVPSLRTLKTDLSVGQPRAQRVRAHLLDHASR
ncbi:DUF2637 domain-containing protein [Nonomuraea typhae]|uniref:DUF2637 domain-containing protein n=1 Tax=Nonomuraea typhae TaxID=2603600 RepID=A0ABW7YL64_9ACTN